VGKHYPYLHQRGDRYYFFWDRDGKRVEESLRTADLEIAKKAYLKRMDEIEAGCTPNDRSGWTLQRAVDEWLERRQLELSTASFNAERSIVRNLLRGFKADSRLQSLVDISKLRGYRYERRKAGAAAKTINNEMLVLRGILELAALWHRVEREYKPLRVKKSDIPDALPDEELTKLLQVAGKSPVTAVAPVVATLAVSTGMRSGEIKRLKRGDVHHRESYPFIRVRRSTTKTDAGSRRVALDSLGVWAAERLLARGCLIGSVKPEDYLLPTDRARHTRPSDPWHGETGFDPRHHQTSWEWEWERFREATGIHRRFHDLRHTYISRAAEAGVPISVLRAQVGHMSDRMVTWYTHISERAQFKAACQLESQSPELLEALGIRTIVGVVQENGHGITGTQPQQTVIASESGKASRPEAQRVRLRRRCRGSFRHGSWARYR
jgi:integrase